MKALQITEPGKIDVVDVPMPELGKGQVVVKMTAAALNRRDQWIRQGKYPNIQYGTTLGSDGCGEVTMVHNKDDKHWIGKKVVINPNVNWGDNRNFQSSDYQVLGMPVDGTLAEYIAVNVDRLVRMPSHMIDEEAAAIPLGGLTAYRAITHHGQLKEGENVLISGFGGGVAQFAFLFAVKMGANVYVTSGSEEKIEKAFELGAKGGFNYQDDQWSREAIKSTRGFDLVIDSAGGDQVDTFIKMMKPGGRIVFYGATNGLPDKIDLYRMFWNQLTLQGSTMGSDMEFVAID